MAMATIGYLEGTDPLVLTRLATRGVGTLPVGNGVDNHGKFITTISDRDEIDLIVGYLHKIMRTAHRGFFTRDLLQSCLDYEIPVLLIVPEADQMAARQVLGAVGESVTLVDPGALYDTIASMVGLLA
jgi:hypothetical protein